MSCFSARASIRHSQIERIFRELTVKKIDQCPRRHKHFKLWAKTVEKRFNHSARLAEKERKKMRFPVCWKINFAGHQTHRKRGKSARASPSPHHTPLEERTARFIAQPFPALIRTFVSRACHVDYKSHMPQTQPKLVKISHNAAQHNVHGSSYLQAQS